MCIKLKLIDVNKIIIVIILAFVGISCQERNLSEVPAQTNHYNHTVFEENKLPPRATFLELNLQILTVRKILNDF